MRTPSARTKKDFPLSPPGSALVLALVLAGAVAGTAQAQEAMHARISFDSGGAMVKGSADADWSYATVNTLVLPGDTLWVDESGTLEVEMSGGTFLRMADRSKAEIVALPPLAVVQGWTGAFYVQRISRSSGDVIFETPVCKVDVARNSQVRIDILTDGATTVTVRWGRAIIRTDGGDDVMVVTGQRSFVDPGYLPSDPRPFDRRQEDPFDTWNRERARMLAIGSESLPSTVVYKSAPVGVADLDPYGEWVYVDSSYYWRPTVVTQYVPYRYGHWSYTPSYGHVWVGDYPFSYVTSHYGRWRYHDNYGWMWGYRDGWGPAWVASVRYGSNFIWCPLDPWNRPVYWGSDYFTVGGIRFGMFGSTYCGVDDLLYGPCGVNPFSSGILRNVPRSDIHIWNINIGSGTGTNLPYRTGALRVRDYAPRRVIRGPDTYGGTKVSARARAVTLEGGHGRAKFATATRSRSVRTGAAPSARSASLRSVRIDRDAAAKVPALRNRSILASTPTERSVTGRAVRTSPHSTTVKTPAAATRSRSVDVSATRRKTLTSVSPLSRSTPSPTRSVTRSTRTPTRSTSPPTRSVSSSTSRSRSVSPPKITTTPTPSRTPTRSMRSSSPPARTPTRAPATSSSRSRVTRVAPSSHSSSRSSSPKITRVTTPSRTVTRTPSRTSAPSVSRTPSRVSSPSTSSRSVRVPTQILGHSSSRSSAPKVSAPSRSAPARIASPPSSPSRVSAPSSSRVSSSSVRSRSISSATPSRGMSISRSSSRGRR